jgi:hypothetical protein
VLRDALLVFRHVVAQRALLFVGSSHSDHPILTNRLLPGDTVLVNECSRLVATIATARLLDAKG